MRAWTSPDVPDLSELGLGRGPAVRVLDTASGLLTTLDPPERARLYVCGITPYDATHLGHAATYLAFDLLQRVWRDRGIAVTYVQNVTDVDDPLLERAAASGIDWADLAEREIELFRQDMTALGIIAPDHYVGAIESIPTIVEVVERLQARDAVYDVDGDLYFSVTSDPKFGAVSGLAREQMLVLSGERGGDPERAGKADPLDCLVWQGAREGEPSWDTVLGAGRPGWHVECTAMAAEYLGHDFDVQGGGSDLVFPHHEMSASQAQVAYDGQPFARAYVHPGMVGFEGEKMSKSKGNLVLVSALRNAGHGPMAIRLALLDHHYRSDWEWTDADLDAATVRLGSWRAAFASGGGPAEPVVTQIRDALTADLDAPTAIAAVDAWVAAAPGDASDGAAGAGELLATAVDALLGVR